MSLVDFEDFLNLDDIREDGSGEYVLSSQLENYEASHLQENVDPPTTVLEFSPTIWSEDVELLNRLCGGPLDTNTDLIMVKEEKHDFSAQPSPSGSEFRSDDGSSLHDESEDAEVASKQHWSLMHKYSLTDASLVDTSLKVLKRLCRQDQQDYDQLKAYRRTCLNRQYARQSRSKQQKVTSGLADQLSAANDELRQLKAELAKKDAKIQSLELENRLLLEFTITNGNVNSQN